MQSRKWSVNRLFGLLALCWFLVKPSDGACSGSEVVAQVGVWWTIRARGCSYSPLLYNVCVSLLWLFCIRTLFVFLVPACPPPDRHCCPGCIAGTHCPVAAGCDARPVQWFGFIFGNQQPTAGYAGPFRKPGASVEMLERLDVSTFGESEIAGEELQCSICLSEFESSDEVPGAHHQGHEGHPLTAPAAQVRRLPCKHYFHKGCIDGWLRISRACPMCNADVASVMPSEGAKEHQS